ncbi:unnamed protein product [Protopolystoma xenopodis]|uniref:Uncharacterized protein n=1 Tax=Protopolystoma xenopodis TaxID=117903 RepID=A0A448WLY9_9PLAT|nr:unnamed protein product [Protopolystoma xenopodis]
MVKLIEETSEALLIDQFPNLLFPSQSQIATFVLLRRTKRRQDDFLMSYAVQAKEADRMSLSTSRGREDG